MTETAGTAQPLRAATWLTITLAVVAGTAATASALNPDLLSGEPVMVGNLRGTGAAVVVVGIPTLLISMRRATRSGSGADGAVPMVVWFGATAYLVYQGVMFCFATPMNPLFLLYVATLGLAIWTLICLWPALSAEASARQGAAGLADAPYRLTAIVLGVAATLNLLAWLARVVPVMQTGERPDVVVDSGLTTNPVLVQDLAFWLPAALVISVATWRRSQLGLLLAGSFLTFWVLEGVTVASDQFFGARADDGYPELASMAVVPGAIIVTAVLAIPLVLLCRSVRAVPDNGVHAGAARG